MIEIVPYSPELKDYFFTINHEWITTMFEIEPLDLEILQNPEELILDRGGFVFFAKHPELGIVGTCALRKTAEGEFELTKMGVLQKSRGLKAGEKLLQHVINFARDNGMAYLYLLTNSQCEAAIHLYLKNGFVHDNEVMERFGGEYQRANVAMRFQGL